MYEEQHIAALRRRLVDLEREISVMEAAMAASPQSATAGDVEVSRWRRAEADAIRLAIELLERAAHRREIPHWMYMLMLMMVTLAMALAGTALWIH